MKNFYYFFIIILIIIIIIFLYKSNENFDFSQLNKPNTLLTQTVNMGDHFTNVLYLKGNSDINVLLLHNTPINKNVWTPLYNKMQNLGINNTKTPNLISYDLRGHGTAWYPTPSKFNDNDLNNKAFTIDLFSEDCKKIYNQVIKTGKIIICGYGFGGLVAQRFSLDNPTLISKLILLQTNMNPTSGILKGIDYLGKKNGWISMNPNITYLTAPQDFLNTWLCEWFYLPPDFKCPPNNLTINDKDDNNFNDTLKPQFNLTDYLLRTSNAIISLQIGKLLATTNFTQEWIKTKNIDFPIHILAATDDPVSTPDKMVQTYTDIYNNNRELTVIFDIVNGKHGFSIMRPDYIANIICRKCKNISPTSTYNYVT